MGNALTDIVSKQLYRNNNYKNKNKNDKDSNINFNSTEQTGIYTDTSYFIKEN